MKTIVIVLTLLTLSSCSSTRLSYGFLDDWIRWQLDDYVELNDQQRQLVNKSIKDFHRWHRQTQLPVYASFIDDVVVLIQEEELSYQGINEQAEHILSLWDMSVAYISPASVNILQTFDKKQIKQLVTRIEKKQSKEFAQRSKLSRDERLNQRRTKTQDMLKKWLGSMTTTQEELINRWVSQIVDINAPRRERQIIWNQAFTSALYQTPSGFSDKDAERLFIANEDLWPEKFRQGIDQNKHLLIKFIIDIHSHMNPQQKQFLIDKLMNYQKDFIYLSDRF